MAEKRKRQTQAINTAYIGRHIRRYYQGSKSKFVSRVKGASRSAVYNALRGIPVEPKIIRCISNADDQLDHEELTAAVSGSPDTRNARDGMLRPAILSLVSIRGGVGKTLIAVSLAAELSTKCRVALVDADLFTYGATRWFSPLLEFSQSPLTFLDIALGMATANAANDVLSPFVEQPALVGSEGTLFFIPSHTSLPDVSKTLAVRPLLINWTVEDAQDAIDLLIERLSELQVDVAILDTHPGLMSLTDVICNEADCNILVSDCDASTAQANWLLAMEIQRRRQLGKPKAWLGAKTMTTAWRMAINRIPSPRTVVDCQRFIDDALQTAMQSWRNEKCEWKFDSGATEPVFLLPEIDAMRLDEREAFSPTSIRRRGGNRTSLATKYLVRRLVSDNILPEAEMAFPYARSDNQIAHQRLSTHLEGYGDPWQPGWWRLDVRIFVALFAIFVLFLVYYVAWRMSPDNWYTQPILRFILGATSSSIVCLTFLVVCGVVREVIKECRGICWFIDACSISEYPPAVQKQIYDDGIYREMTPASRMILSFLLLVAIVPTTGFTGLLYDDVGSLWKYSTEIAVALMLILTLWFTPGKASVLRVLQIGLSSVVPRLFGRR